MDCKLRIAGVTEESTVDGPGLRYVVFTQGCPHGCLGCHNPQTHLFDGGYDVLPEQLYDTLRHNPLLKGVTFSGGEPFCQPAPLAVLAKKIREDGRLDLIIYTGYVFSELMAMKDPAVMELLHLADWLIDGRYEQDKRDLTLRFRGSSNQRIIDLSATFRQGKVVTRPDF